MRDEARRAPSRRRAGAPPRSHAAASRAQGGHAGPLERRPDARHPPAELVLLDWDLATLGAPAAELAWYLCHDAWRIDATKDELVEDFLAAEDGAVSAEALDLGLISGLVQYGWIFGHSAVVHPDPAERAWAREELGWWVPRVRAALERTGVPAPRG